MDFNVIEETAALTSITKSRVRGPKKKTRPTKSCAITTLDPFEVAAERYVEFCLTTHTMVCVHPTFHHKRTIRLPTLHERNMHYFSSSINCSFSNKIQTKSVNPDQFFNAKFFPAHGLTERETVHQPRIPNLWSLRNLRSECYDSL